MSGIAVVVFTLFLYSALCTSLIVHPCARRCAQFLLALSGAGPVYFQDIWAAHYTEGQGLVFHKRTDAAPFSQRASHAMVPSNFGGVPEVRVLGGADENGVRRDVWVTSDGETWTPHGVPPWVARMAPAAVYCQVRGRHSHLSTYVLTFT